MKKNVIRCGRLKKHGLVLLILALASLFATSLSVYTSPWVEQNKCFSSSTRHIPITHESFTYHVNCDSQAFIDAGKDFPTNFIDHKIRMSRPVYPALESILLRINDVFSGLTGALLLNLAFAFSASVMFYIVVKSYFDKKVALISALLLIFSTHFRIFLGQAHTEVAGDFVIICSLFLLWHYIRHRSPGKLVLFSIVSGFLMLLKLVFALPIFFLILALRYRRYKDYLVYVSLLILPTIGWYLFVTKILKTAFYSAEVEIYQQGTWFFSFIFDPSKWDDLVRAFIFSNGLFIIDIFLAFLVFLPVLSLYGLLKWSGPKDKYIWYVAFVSSFALMLFALLWGGPRLAFGTFPFIIPFAVYGFFQLYYKINHLPLRIVFSTVVLLPILFVSFVNIYDWIPSYDNNHVRAISDTPIENHK